ncbi:MAG: TIGR04282 family arsenosugar biosynthesis glycosyltransferase [Gammaproteobacteria bacterium]|nr:TIGR04282 family arsenosugar biosynthesis glycosyltransferase [Gammaproteobacteria bacterium]
MHYYDGKIIVFARTPIMGKVKTRLIPALGAEGARNLHCQMIEHTLGMLSSTKMAPLELHCSPDINHEYLISLSSRYQLELKHQYGSNLGNRMSHALDQALNDNRYVILIGTDCPALTSSYIRQALEILQSGTDIVIGPAKDGGYVLIGTSRKQADIFTDIDWGTNRVLQQTRNRIINTGLSYKELETLWDVDIPEDLENIINDKQLTHLLSHQNITLGHYEY